LPPTIVVLPGRLMSVPALLSGDLFPL